MVFVPPRFVSFRRHRFARSSVRMLSEPRQAVSTALFRRRSSTELLLVKRSKDPYQHHWSFPGGELRANETLLEGAHRELLEETGIPLASVKILPDPVVLVLSPDEKTPLYQIHLFAGVITNDIPFGAYDDAEDAAFHEMSELSKLQAVPNLHRNALLAFDSIRTIVKDENDTIW